MRNLFIVVILVLMFFSGCKTENELKVLVFSKTVGYRHKSIEAGVEAVKQLGSKNGIKVVHTENSEFFNEDSLKSFSAVIFLNTTLDVLDYYQQADFERYIQAGGGFVGIHASADTEYDWHWYGKLNGAYFKSHPKVQPAKLQVVEKGHPCTSMWEDVFDHEDEWYNYKDIYEGINPLITIDETSYEGGENGEFHPMSWYHEYDGGRSFYTNLGHREETFANEKYLQHLLEGIKYAIGNNERDYSKAKSDRLPLENRFVRSILLQNLNEPMEVDVLDDENLILVERPGFLKVYNLKEEKIVTNIEIPVFSKLEEGLLGVAVDPNYEHTGWIYLFRSIDSEDSVQYISRFDFDGKTLDMSSEKVLIKVKVQRETCCHAAGSLEFGPDGLLYIATGDNTNPFASDGYNPIDERPGRSGWDAQKSSANANDLRGKILRIKPLPDGTYEIPEGNLFPPGTPGTRPEIYAMGLRNPFRISIDYKRNWLYWGDVGPDARANSPERGPKGLDEINQARQAGFWGWPYTRGNNQVYADHNFDTTLKSSETSWFDPQKPINNSPNNTGTQELPPIQKSLIWYSYDKSEEFPWVGVGGKNPMAGPIYYSDMFEGAGSKFPEYFDGKLFFYEWIRDWIYIVTMDENGDFLKAEPFMPNSVFNNPTDMVFGKDGALYVLEYGEKWFAQNVDARLNKIEYVPGNRAPIAMINSDKTVGAAPLTVAFSGKGSEDYDRDNLQYSWNFTGTNGQATSDSTGFTFENPGIYTVVLTVTDPKGQTSVAQKEIMVGNAPPSVSVAIEGDNMMFWDGRQIAYKVKVTDAEDGSSEDGSINLNDIKVSMSYIPEGADMAGAVLGHQENTKPEGLQLIEGSDCKACHSVEQRVNGPSYREIAAKYSASDMDYLVNKIYDGGSGVWGEGMMSAHPQHTKEQIAEMVRYILTTDSDPESTTEGLPLEGVLTFDEHKGTDGAGKYVLIATYTDKGANDISPITERQRVFFTPSKLEAEDNDQASDGVNTADRNGVRFLNNLRHNRNFMYKSVSMDGLASIDLFAVIRPGQSVSGKVEVRIDKADGDVVGEYDFSPIKGPGIVKIPVTGKTGLHDVYFVFKNEENKEKNIVGVDWVKLNYSK